MLIVENAFCRRYSISPIRSSVIHTHVGSFFCCCASCQFTPAECRSKGHRVPPDECGSPWHWHPHLMCRGGWLLASHGQPAHGGRALVCSFEYAGGWVAANDLLAVPGVDGALPRRHAPPFPSGARPPGQKREHHVPLSVWSAAVLSRCPGTQWEPLLLQK